MKPARRAPDFYLSSASLAQRCVLPGRTEAALTAPAGLGQENERSSLALHSAGKGPSLGWGLGQERWGGELSGRVGLS